MPNKQTTRAASLATLILFVILLGAGFCLARHKPLWNDEIYTHLSSVEKPTYRGILTLQFEEGNSTPLFYIIQKGICDLFRYKFPREWDGSWEIADLRSQRILRINPNIFMSLSIAFIFYYFMRYYSVWAGLYSLLITLSSFMVWAYWVEARPYALWAFLTTAQSLLFLTVIREKNPGQGIWRWLTTIHILLSLCVIFGMIQVVIVSFLLWVVKDRNLNFIALIKKHFFLTIIPVGICFFYYSLSPKFRFWFSNTPMELVGASIPKDRMLIFAIYAFFLITYYLQKKTRLIKLYNEDISLSEGSSYLAVTALMLASAFSILMIFKMGASGSQEGFPVSNRYFIYLAPVGIIATTVFSVDLLRAGKGRIWFQALICIGLAGLLFLRAQRTLMLVRGHYT